MTAWQDQPPQTRRQLRLSEQRDGAREDGTESANPEEHVNVRLEDVRREDDNAAQTPTPHIETFARQEWEAPARRSSAHESWHTRARRRHTSSHEAVRRQQ